MPDFKPFSERCNVARQVSPSCWSTSEKHEIEVCRFVEEEESVCTGKMKGGKQILNSNRFGSRQKKI
ncbi:hypothetical protein EXN66_Car021748 [Channa argus]|uniref:Uncharacterized protein n=1 Tax=Channa argus TaxID=215402 RepID=A0A6G1QU94_CHAAH|nr:hypothetical protein EXN66_Car021748 [Channa argus]